MKAFILVALFLTVPAQLYQIHYISGGAGEFHDQSVPLDTLPLVIVDSMGLGHCVNGERSIEDDQVRQQLAEIAGNPVAPVKAFWTIYVAGMSGCDEMLGDLSGHYRTVFRCNLSSDNTTADLGRLLILNEHHVNSTTVRNNTHIGTLLTKSMYPDSFVMFNSKSLELLLLLSPATFPLAKFEHSYYSGTRPFVAKLKELRSLDLIDTLKFFDISETDRAIDSQNLFFSECQRVVSILDYLESGKGAGTGRSDFKAPKHDVLTFGLTGLQDLAFHFGLGSEQHTRAQYLFVKNILPKIIWRFAELYGDQSLGTIVFLDEVNLDPNASGSRVFDRFQTYVKEPDSQIPFCYSSYDECIQDTNRCFGSGVCKAINFRDTNRQNESSCWQCSCYYGYDGFACQYEDISVPFFTSVAVSLIFCLGVAGSVYYLAKLTAGHSNIVQSPHAKTN